MIYTDSLAPEAELYRSASQEAWLGSWGGLLPVFLR